MTAPEVVTRRDGSTFEIVLCPDCGGRPASAARLFAKPNLERFCSCPFNEAHTS
jgi:hypothetical protein